VESSSKVYNRYRLFNLALALSSISMKTSQLPFGFDRSRIIASRRGFLGGIGAVPAVFFSPSASTIDRNFDADVRPGELKRTSQGRQLSRSRYHNAEGFFRFADQRAEVLDADALYSIGIVIQLGLSAHLLDVGFDDQWCARHLGLHVSRSLAWANATGFGFETAGFELLAALLSPYGKWRHAWGRDTLDFPFTQAEILLLVRLMLDHVRGVTGHPRPRGLSSGR
jgi:hypothetical protein